MNGNKIHNAIWGGFSASVRGPLHIRLDLPNQDYGELRISDTKLYAVVADGVGSRIFSHLGSMAVCSAVQKLVNSISEININEPELILRTFHQLWIDELTDQVIDECSSTALFAIAINDTVFLAQLGDGACCVISPNELDSVNPKISFLSNKQEDFFSNQTRALCHNFSFKDWSYCSIKLENVIGLFLVTDGIFDDLVDLHRPQFFKELFNYYAGLDDGEVKKDAEQWLSNWPVLGHSDDKTIVALYQKNKQINLS